MASSDRSKCGLVGWVLKVEPTFKWNSRPILSIVLFIGDLVRKNGLTGIIGLTRIELRVIVQETYVHRYTVSALFF